MSTRQLSFRELWKMGVYKLPPRDDVMNTTISGRVSKRPQKFTEMSFVKGSGAAPRKGFDETDMSKDMECDCECHFGDISLRKCSHCDRWGKRYHE